MIILEIDLQFIYNPWVRSSKNVSFVKLIFQLFSRLVDTLKEKLFKASSDLEDIEETFRDIAKLEGSLIGIQKEVTDFFVFGEDTTSTERELSGLRIKVSELIDRTKFLTANVKNRYMNLQQLVPSDISQKLSSLELLSETISNAMDEKDREFKRARTIRSDYLTDVDEVQSWIQSAETKIQDRSIEPQHLQNHLQQIQSEIGTITDRLEKLIKNGKIIIEKTRDDEEKALIQKTIDNLTEQLQQVRTWLEEKKAQVGDSLDAWQRFLSLHQQVMAWVEEKRGFLVEPLQLSTLQQTRQKLHDYSVRISFQTGFKHTITHWVALFSQWNKVFS